jgi:hypothetical protein
MSKKKSKAAPKKKATMKSKAARKPATRAALGTAAGGRTVNATIFIYRTANGNKIRTSPQRLFANPGDRIEWTVVNMVDGSEVPVTITWPESGPWGKEPVVFRNDDRKALSATTTGRFKYVVSALDAQEDPEIEIPDV